MVCYQIFKELDPKLSLASPEKCNNSDNNHGLGEEWVKMVVTIRYPDKLTYNYHSSYTSYKSFPVPRILYFKRSWSMKEVHFKLFTFFRKVFKNWVELLMNKKTEHQLDLVSTEGNSR